jgi:hypothetical protein
LTVSSVPPVVPLNVAFTVVCPCVALDASPVLLTTATVGVVEVHCETVVMSCVEPSLKEPIAANCCIEPKAIVGEAGVTLML